MIDLDRVDLYESRTRLVGSRDLFSVSEVYHENSKIAEWAPRIALTPESILVAPTGFKRYIYAPKEPLPEPRRERPVFAAMVHRRSCREYANVPLVVDAVSVLAFHGLGVLEGRR